MKANSSLIHLSGPLFGVKLEGDWENLIGVWFHVLSDVCIFDNANKASGKAGGVAGVFVGGFIYKQKKVIQRLIFWNIA